MAQKTTLRILKSGSYGRTASQDVSTRGAGERVLIATSESDYRTLWRDHIGEDPAPAVDFSRESAVFLLLGTRSTGGYAVTAEEAVIDGGVARITAPVTSPGSDSIVTMAITAPFAVIAVSQPDVTTAEWRDRDRVVARAERKLR